MRAPRERKLRNDFFSLPFYVYDSPKTSTNGELQSLAALLDKYERVYIIIIIPFVRREHRLVQTGLSL